MHETFNFGKKERYLLRAQIFKNKLIMKKAIILVAIVSSIALSFGIVNFNDINILKNHHVEKHDKYSYAYDCIREAELQYWDYKYQLTTEIQNYINNIVSTVFRECYEKGKPYVKGLPVCFSISHSGDYAVCVVSDEEIGIDIEKIRPINKRVADKFATEKEKEYILSSSNGFFEIWTLKEAYFKCIGTGLGKDIKEVSFDISDNNIAFSKSGYEFTFCDINKNYICSICKKAAR